MQIISALIYLTVLSIYSLKYNKLTTSLIKKMISCKILTPTRVNDLYLKGGSTEIPLLISI